MKKLVLLIMLVTVGGMLMVKKIEYYLILVCLLVCLEGCKKEDGISVYNGESDLDISYASPDSAAKDASQIYADDVTDAQTTGTNAKDDMVYVDICGSVNNPGVYSVKKEARVFEVIEAAGGLTLDACYEAVNQAEQVFDGQKIYIPSVTEWDGNPVAVAGNSNTNSKEGLSRDDGLININLATETELCMLPGIGETRAKAIISYREKHGSFKSKDELKNVSGIKDGTYNKICDLIKVQ